MVAGALVARDAALGDKLLFVQNGIGAILGPQDADTLVIRGLKTLALRMNATGQRARGGGAFLSATQGGARLLPGHGRHALLQRPGSGLVPQVLAGVRLCLFAPSRWAASRRSSPSPPRRPADIPVARRNNHGITDSTASPLRGYRGLHDDIISDPSRLALGVSALSNFATRLLHRP